MYYRGTGEGLMFGAPKKIFVDVGEVFIKHAWITLAILF